MNAIGHEGEHAFQHDVIINRDRHREVSNATAETYAYEFANYIPYSVDKDMYDAQLIEIHANVAGKQLEAQLPLRENYFTANTSPTPLTKTTGDNNSGVIESTRRAEIMKRLGKSAVPEPPPKQEQPQSHGLTM